MGTRISPAIEPLLVQLLEAASAHFDHFVAGLNETARSFSGVSLPNLRALNFESWAKESYEIATKIAYRNGARIGIPRGGNLDCTMVAAVPVLPVGYVVSASRIADRRMILAGYRLAELIRLVSQK